MFDYFVENNVRLTPFLKTLCITVVLVFMVVLVLGTQ